MITLLSIIYAFSCVLLIIIILIQSGKGAGMGIFGGGGSNTTFGAQGGNILTKITTVLGIIFFGVAIILAVDKTKGPVSDKFRKQLQQQKDAQRFPHQSGSQNTGKTNAMGTNKAPGNR